MSEGRGDNWFRHCRDLDEARAEYRRLCFVYHPDHGGDTLVMQAINVAYTQFQRRLAGPRGAGDARRGWDKTRRRPQDVPWHPRPRHEPQSEPVHSRDYFLRIWNHAPWQLQAHGGWTRTLWEHTVVVYQHDDPRFGGAWFVLLDDVFSPYFYATRGEAEQAGFELLYEKVKHLP